MKAIIRQRNNEEMTVQYNKIVRQPAYRYSLLKNILGSINDDITMFIDTNQRIAERPLQQLEETLQKMQIRYQFMKVESNPKSFFGISISQKKKPFREHKIIMELPDNTFPKDLFEAVKTYDLSFGFGKNKTFEELCQDYRMDNTLVVFNPTSFHKSLYDSVVCECLRSSFDVEQFARKAEDEITD